MKASLFTVAAAFACSAALAGESDPSGQFALKPDAGARAQAELVRLQQSGVVDPEAARHKTRAQVQSEFLADRDEALALTGEDSGSVYLARPAIARDDHGHVLGAGASPR